MSVHVVGNLCVDTTLAVPRFPQPGETLVALASWSGLGGKGLNQAVAAARAGVAVTLHASVGAADLHRIRDMFGGEARLTLALTALSLPSDSSMILVRPDGENCIVSTTDCARAVDPAAAARLGDACAPGDIMLMQGNLSPEATRACLAAARRRGASTVLNPSPLWAEAPTPWTKVDWLVVNAHEVQALSDQADATRGAALLVDRGVGAVVVTLGRGGAFMRSAQGCFAVQALAVEARDTSGAGDVFCGVFVATLARGADGNEALARATAAASLSVTRPGALASCPSADEIAALTLPAVFRSPA